MISQQQIKDRILARETTVRVLQQLAILRGNHILSVFAVFASVFSRVWALRFAPDAAIADVRFSIYLRD